MKKLGVVPLVNFGKKEWQEMNGILISGILCASAYLRIYWKSSVCSWNTSYVTGLEKTFFSELDVVCGEIPRKA